MQEIEIKITIEEANLILEALGDLPFARVYALIAKLQTQATQQLNHESEEAKPAGDNNNG